MKQIPLVLDQDYPRCCRKLDVLHSNDTQSFAISSVLPEYAHNNGVASSISLDALIAPLYKFKDKDLELHFLCFANDQELKDGLASHQSHVYSMVPKNWKVTAYAGIDQTDHALNKVENVENGCHLEYSKFSQDNLDKAQSKGFKNVYLFDQALDKAEWSWHKIAELVKNNQGLKFLVKTPKILENSLENLEQTLIDGLESLENLELLDTDNFWNKAFNIRPRVVVPVRIEE
jgi:hypothetical protein